MKFGEALAKGTTIVLGCLVGLLFLVLVVWGLIKLSAVFLVFLAVFGIVIILAVFVSLIIWLIELIKKRRRR